VKQQITFTMTPHAEGQPKHSTRFDFERLDAAEATGILIDQTKFKPSFYIPKPFGAGAKRVRVTIEVVD
jgi:hypothetical protein